MKTLFCISLLIVAFSQITFCQTMRKDSGSSSESDQNIPAYEMNFDAGYYPFRNDVGVGWQPLYSFRVGAGKLLSEEVVLHLFTEYYSHKLSFSGGTYGFSPQSTKRYDIALYGVITFFKYFDAGIGAYYSKSDNVVTVYPGSTRPPESWMGGGVSKFSFFFTAGGKYEIPLGSQLNLPIGIYYRDPGYNSSSTPILIRIGIAKKF